MPAAKNIFIFGDSITYGEWDASGGWANRLREYYDHPKLPLPENFIVTYNLGIPSDTSTGVAERFSRETQARISPNPAVNNFQFIIAIGANDSRWLIEEKEHAVSPEQFKANLKDITQQAKHFSDDIVFVGLLPVIESQLQASSATLNGIESYENQYIQIYNDMLKQHCQAENIPFVDVYKRFEDEDINTLFDDGIHPNTQGHTLVFDYILEFLHGLNKK